MNDNASRSGDYDKGFDEGFRAGLEEGTRKGAALACLSATVTEKQFRDVVDALREELGDELCLEAEQAWRAGKPWPVASNQGLARSQ